MQYFQFCIEVHLSSQYPTSIIDNDEEATSSKSESRRYVVSVKRVAEDIAKAPYLAEHRANCYFW